MEDWLPKTTSWLLTYWRTRKKKKKKKKKKKTDDNWTECWADVIVGLKYVVYWPNSVTKRSSAAAAGG